MAFTPSPAIQAAVYHAVIVTLPVAGSETPSVVTLLRLREE
jgi:hypothetical protein